MIKGAILDKGEDGYTYFKKIFKALNNFQKDYNWLITDCEASPKRWGHEIRIHQSKHGEYAWISGEELTGIIKKDDFQWVWAVLSGFDKSCSKDDVLNYEFPAADGYGGFWEEKPSIQHPLARIELVAWDSDLTLFISKDEDLVNRFRNAFPLSRDLEEYNAELQAAKTPNTELFQKFYHKYGQERTWPLICQYIEQRRKLRLGIEQSNDLL